MEKPVATDLPIHELLRRRYSPRAFSERPVTDEHLRVLFEAARWAPSSFNEQPWRFIVANRSDEAEFARMLECIMPMNAAWAGNAAALFIGVASASFRRNGKSNKHAGYDLGQAVAMLTVQATSMDLFLHQMAGFDADKTRATYGIPEGYEPFVAVAIGYLGDPDTLPERLAERERAPRARMPLEDILFTGSWPSPPSE